MQSYLEMMQSTFDNITQIGAGGGGTIFKAYHKRLDIEVVLKKIHTNQLKSIDHKGERDILIKLKNDYIPQIYDFIEYGDDVFTVMEYIPGQSFAQLLEQKKKFSQKEVAKWLRQLCEVVDYLHSQNPAIIHCDIKPANVMLTPQGNICLIDFNISGVKSEEGIAAIGYSNGYAPVEQFAVVARRLEKASGTVSNVSAQSRVAEESDDDKTEVIDSFDDDKTEVIDSFDDDKTEVVDSYDDDKTEVTDKVPAPRGKTADPITPAQQVTGTRSLMRSFSDEDWARAKETEASVGRNLMIDERTDIYSVGATMYHILTGVRPQPFFKEQIPLQSINPDISESIAYVIEKAMEVNPNKRFANSRQLLKTVQNMGSVDKRYKGLIRKQIITFLTTVILTAASVVTIFAGKQTMEQERQDAYKAFIEEMQAARAEQDYDALDAAYKEAIALSPEQQEAYYEKSMAYYSLKEYDDCIVFLSENVYTNGDVMQDSGYGRFYYITASCYFEREDYSSAISYYEQALKLQPEEMAYYRDYVVALARSGRIDDAEATLQEAVGKGISGDVIKLLNGEIALLKGNYTEGEQYLKECIAETADDYMKLRAYTKLDDAYQMMYAGEEQYDMRIAYINEALAILPVQHQITLMERLAQVYIDYSDVKDNEMNCQNAINVFNEMESLGYATFTSKYNIAVLYEKMGNYSEALEQLNTMLNTYPNNYNIYKRMAFVELSVQASLPNESRGYEVFNSYYEQALTLYQENAKEDDVEMLSLQQLYSDVVANGWL